MTNTGTISTKERTVLLRRVHAYLAIFVAPSILLFAVTGALQLFNLHEAHDGYVPPALIQKLATLHKDQSFSRSAESAAPSGPTGERSRGLSSHLGMVAAPQPAQGTPDATLVLKWFFLLMTVGLCASTSIGLWLGVLSNRHRTISWLLLGCGTAIPVVLTILTSLS